MRLERGAGGPRSRSVADHKVPDPEARLSRHPKYAVPASKAVVLRRQRLLDLLYQNIDQSLQLVCAPAGYGKTTLLADFARDTDIPVCWYAVEELDSDPRSFLHHMVDAIRSRFPSVGYPRALEYGQSPDFGAGWQGTVSGVTDWVRQHIRQYFILVIDDFHLVSSNPAITDILDLVLERLPDNWRLIVSTREIPQSKSLPRLVSQRRVSGVGVTELKFSPSEIQVFLRRNSDLEVSEEEAHRLQEQSEGWITSILLTTHSLWKGLFRDVILDKGPKSLLFEYIASEIFSQQPQVIQQFLLSTSICNEFDADIGDTLTGADTAANTLAEIESRNLFIIRVEGSHPWYGYHHLFRDFLRDKLKKDSPPEFLRLNARAAGYYLSIGQPRQAIQH